MTQRSYETEKEIEDLCNNLLFEVRASKEKDRVSKAEDVLSQYVGGLCYLVDEMVDVDVVRGRLIEVVNKMLSNPDYMES